jgi:hypothetical protein
VLLVYNSSEWQRRQIRNRRTRRPASKELAQLFSKKLSAR